MDIFKYSTCSELETSGYCRVMTAACIAFVTTIVSAIRRRLKKNNRI